MKKSKRVRLTVLAASIILIWIVQCVPALASFYCRTLYPLLATVLSTVSGLVPVSVGEILLCLGLAGLIVFPFYARRRKKTWRRIFANIAEGIAWLYVWFYIAWGLNYAGPDFYRRTKIAPAVCNAAVMQTFAENYIAELNAACLPQLTVHRDTVRNECVRIYREIADTLGINRLWTARPRAKTMLFTKLASCVGVTGSMGPFSGEFTLNGELLPMEFAATYAHELSHLLGIAREAEANFYAYEVCRRSHNPAMRFSGLFLMLNHVLSNAKRLLSEENFTALRNKIRPEVIALAKIRQQYWAERYSSTTGSIQHWFYDLFLRSNRIASGTANYSEVVSLMIAVSIAADNAK